MNTRRTFRIPAAPLTTLWLLLGLLPPNGQALRAQSSTLSQSDALGTMTLRAQQAKQQAYINSKALFASNNLASAQAVLETGNIQPAGTPGWNLESGCSLLRVAFYFKSHGNTALAATVARLALGQFSQAERKFTAATSAAEIANEKEISGYIYEHLLGDRTTAGLFYTQAVNLSPNTGQAAAFLDRLNRFQVEEAKKHTSG